MDMDHPAIVASIADGDAVDAAAQQASQSPLHASGKTGAGDAGHAAGAAGTATSAAAWGEELEVPLAPWLDAEGAVNQDFLLVLLPRRCTHATSCCHAKVHRGRRCPAGVHAIAELQVHARYCDRHMTLSRPGHIVEVQIWKGSICLHSECLTALAEPEGFTFEASQLWLQQSLKASHSRLHNHNLTAEPVASLSACGLRCCFAGLPSQRILTLFLIPPCFPRHILQTGSHDACAGGKWCWREAHSHSHTHKQDVRANLQALVRRALVAVDSMPGAPEELLLAKAMDLVCPSNARILLQRMVRLLS
eukprot:scaffold150733_cov19-Tisochrysis_lutea.AAC.1